MKCIVAGSKCFPAGTHVVTEHGTRKIESLQIGDTVVAVCFETKTRCLATVERVDVEPEKILLEIEFEGGDTLVTTPTQRLRSGDKWLLSGDIKSKHYIGNCRVTSVKLKTWNKEVYTLVVTPCNNYVVLTEKNTEIICHDNSSDLGESKDFVTYAHKETYGR